MAFNVQNISQLKALVISSQRLNRPAICQLSAKYADRAARSAQLRDFIRIARQGSVYVHLDHCTDIHLIYTCILQGFDSVMFDGSNLPFEENVQGTNEVVALASRYGCLVEAELGRISGVEDGYGGAEGDAFQPEEFARFCKEVGATLIAPAIGNAHGFYRDTHQVKIEILPEANRRLSGGQHLVLHGGTGLGWDLLKAAVGAGVVKINVSTDLKQKTHEILSSKLSAGSLFDQLQLDQALEEHLPQLYSEYIQRYSPLC